MTTKQNIARVQAAAAKKRPSLADKLVLAKEAARIAKDRAAAIEGHYRKLADDNARLAERMKSADYYLEVITRNVGGPKREDLLNRVHDVVKQSAAASRVWVARPTIETFLDIARTSKMTSNEIAAAVLAFVEKGMEQ